MSEASKTTGTNVDRPHRRPEDITILIVDDEVDITKYLGTVLTDAGMNVLIAHDGDEALDALKRQVPDLISLDLVMPGKSGIRVLMELRKNREWSRIPVIIVTAHARDPKVQRDLRETLADSTMVGPSLYLEKPVTPQSYLRSIRCQDRGTDVRRLQQIVARRGEAAPRRRRPSNPGSCPGSIAGGRHGDRGR